MGVERKWSVEGHGDAFDPNPTRHTTAQYQEADFGDWMIMVWHRSNQTCKHVHDIPGVGPMLATAWSQALLLTPGPSGQDVTSRPELGWFPSSTHRIFEAE
jgi:hypothetical protein